MKTRSNNRCGLGVFFLLLLTGCVKEEDDYISKYCPGSCTEVSGLVLQAAGGNPIKGMQVAAIWDNRRSFKEGMGGTVRKKAVAYTDDKGTYTLRFLLRDEEMLEGEIEITPQGRGCNETNCQRYTLYWDELRRDTTYIYDFVIN